MALSNFDEETFVAFLDISGFKEMMKDKEKVIDTLNHFYQTGYNVLSEHQNIQGLFISDCGILYVRDTDRHIREQLEVLLIVVKCINEELLRNDIMLTTSIAYGHFSYRQKIEFQGIEKNLLHGYAYVNAYFDNEKGTPKIQPGQCRLIKENLPLGFEVNNPFMREKGNHFYYYWNVQNHHEIDDFLNEYNDSYKLKYTGMLQALKSHLR